MENTEIYTNITNREERNKMKKFTVCLLIGAMAASMLTGCGSNGGSSDSSDSKDRQQFRNNDYYDERF